MDIKSIDNNINFIAHRGFSISAPENTMPALEQAAKNEFDTVECDISWTKDNVPVLLHDNTINRTARHESGFPVIFPRKCSSLNYEKLLEYDFGFWKGEKFKSTKILSFQEALDFCKDNDLNMYIDLKSDEDFDSQRAQMLVDMVKDAKMDDRVSWISFDEDNLDKIEDYDPSARLGYLSKTEMNDETIDVLEKLKTDENEVFLDIKACRAAEIPKGADFDFEVWGLSSFQQLDDLVEMGYSGFTTDFLNDTLYDLHLKYD